jgi:hypothetical protein
LVIALCFGFFGPAVGLSGREYLTVVGLLMLVCFVGGALSLLETPRFARRIMSPRPGSVRPRDTEYL